MPPHPRRRDATAAPLAQGGSRSETSAPPNVDIEMNQPVHNPDEIAARRKAARRTALWVAAIAVAVYVVFIAMNTVGK